MVRLDYKLLIIARTLFSFYNPRTLRHRDDFLLGVNSNSPIIAPEAAAAVAEARVQPFREGLLTSSRTLADGRRDRVLSSLTVIARRLAACVVGYEQ